MLQHDEAKAYIQTRMQILYPIRKAVHLKHISATKASRGHCFALDAKRGIAKLNSENI